MRTFFRRQTSPSMRFCLAILGLTTCVLCFSPCSNLPVVKRGVECGDQKRSKVKSTFPLNTWSCAAAHRDDSEIDASERVVDYEAMRKYESALVWSFPPFTMLWSFFTYTEVSGYFRNTVEYVSNKSWTAPDGGRLIADILTAAINGPIMATISILFATLVAVTVSTLYERQVDLHKSFSKEVDELRRLSFLLAALPDPYRTRAKRLMNDYMQHLYDMILQGDVTAETRLQSDTDDLFLLLTRVSKACHADPSITSSSLLGYAIESLIRVEDERTKFITILQSVFPPLHYVNLALLAFSICFVYLLETDQDVILFLAAFQLRFLWAVLIGVFATICTVVYDLNDPFRGSYSITSSTEDELDTMRACLMRSWEDLDDNVGQA